MGFYLNKFLTILLVLFNTMRLILIAAFIAFVAAKPFVIQESKRGYQSQSQSQVSHGGSSHQSQSQVQVGKGGFQGQSQSQSQHGHGGSQGQSQSQGQWNKRGFQGQSQSQVSQ